MNWLLTVVIAALTLVIGVLIGYLKSYTSAYAAKKGETTAIQEKLKTLVEQGRTLTQATKEIEAKISDDVWARQRRWELKKEIALEVLRVFGDLQFSLRTFGVANASDSGPFQNEDQKKDYERRSGDISQTVDIGVRTIGQLSTISQLVFGEDVRNAILKAHAALVNLAADAVQAIYSSEGFIFEARKSSDAIQVAVEAIRTELQLD
jgi:hypothetical protein